MLNFNPLEEFWRVKARAGKAVVFFAAIFLSFQFALASDLNESLQNGVMMVRTLEGGPAYLLYIPRKGGENAPVFVTVHGISRDAIEQAYMYADLAERYGVVMIAPYFSEPPFSDYQFMGRNGRGQRADLALDKIADEVGKLTHANVDKLYLFGYSGGGQCVHRYTLAHPGRVAKVAIGAAGWYTFPDPDLPYPYGLKVSRKDLSGVVFDPGKFLQVPTRVFVGAEDVKQDPALNKSLRIVRQQGETRVERAQNWIVAMKKAADSLGVQTPYSVELLPGAGHSYSQSMQIGGMGPKVFSFLFETSEVPARVSTHFNNH